MGSVSKGGCGQSRFPPIGPDNSGKIRSTSQTRRGRIHEVSPTNAARVRKAAGNPQENRLSPLINANSRPSALSTKDVHMATAGMRKFLDNPQGPNGHTRRSPSPKLESLSPSSQSTRSSSRSRSPSPLPDTENLTKGEYDENRDLSAGRLRFADHSTTREYGKDKIINKKTRHEEFVPGDNVTEVSRGRTSRAGVRTRTRFDGLINSFSSTLANIPDLETNVKSGAYEHSDAGLLIKSTIKSTIKETIKNLNPDLSTDKKLESFKESFPGSLSFKFMEKFHTTDDAFLDAVDDSIRKELASGSLDAEITQHLSS